MANEEHVAIVRQGAEAISKWREQNANVRLDLVGARLSGLRLEGANLKYADLEGVLLPQTNLKGAELGNSNLPGAKANGADFQRATFFEAKLGRANLRGANLAGANLHGADLDDAILESANLCGAKIFRANVEYANLNRAELVGAVVSKCNMRRADLSGATLEREDLEGSLLLETNFTNAILESAKVKRAIIAETGLAGVNFKYCSFGWTRLLNLDLSAADNLGRTWHQGPSSVGVDSLIRSRGGIPPEFLRNCGLPPWTVESNTLHDPHLSASEVAEKLSTKMFGKRAHGPIFIGGVFVSYSHTDSDFVDKIAKRLKDEGAAVWLDRHDAVAGSLQKQVSRAIRLQDVVLLVLSEHSVESDWVANELEMARDEEKRRNRETNSDDDYLDVLCPVALDDSWKRKTSIRGNDPERRLWRQLEQKLILDFCDWQGDGFEEPFRKLVRGIKQNYPMRKD